MKVKFYIGSVLLFLTVLCNSSIANDQEKLLYLKQSATDIVIGDKNAPNIMIEYSSYSCPHCSHFHEATFPIIKEKFIDTGKIKWITRLFVNNPASVHGSMITLCKPENFEIMSKILFAKQSSWVFSRDYKLILKNIALLSGMTEPEFNKCISDQALENLLMEQRMQATKILGIKGTPSFFLNGKEIVIENLDKFIIEIEQIISTNK